MPSIFDCCTSIFNWCCGNRDFHALTENLIATDIANVIYGVNIAEHLPDHEHGGLGRMFYEYYHRDVVDPMLGGWKLHLSIAANENHVAAATATLIPILSQFDIKHFKIVTESYIEYTSDQYQEHQGKTITIYLRYNRNLREPELMVEFLQAIETEFSNANIPNGPSPIYDRQIIGSEYIYYRCDAGEEIDRTPSGELLAPPITGSQVAHFAETEGGPEYNPFGHDDIYHLESIEVQNVITEEDCCSSIANCCRPK